MRLCDDQRTCVREEFWCNGHEHCHDSSDELAVNCNLCEDQDEELFRCIFEGKDRQEKQKLNNLDNLIDFRCLPIALKCNGVSNCDDWSDENPADCDDCKKPGLTKCDDSLICVLDHDVCDGVPHCLDKSDESDCKMVCDDVDTFRCEDESRCIPTSALCNGLNECLDASDETPEMCGEADTSGKFR